MSSSSLIQSATTQHEISYISCGPSNSSLKVICVHGWACQATNYSCIFNEFLKTNLKFQAFAIDLPGHGTSSTRQNPAASISGFAEAVITFANDLQLTDVVLVGHSMGMRVVQLAWQQSRSVTDLNVRGLIFLDGSHYNLRKSALPFDSGDAVSTPLSPKQKSEKMVESFMDMFSAKTPPEFQASALAHLKGMNKEYNVAMRRSYISYDREQMDGVLAQIGEAGVPLLNLQTTDINDQNKRVPLEEGERSRWMVLLQEKVPQVEQFVIGQSGHFPQVDQPGEVAKRFLEFLGSLDDLNSEDDRLNSS